MLVMCTHVLDKQLTDVNVGFGTLFTLLFPVEGIDSR